MNLLANSIGTEHRINLFWSRQGKHRVLERFIDSSFMPKPHILMAEAKAGVKPMWLGNLEDILHALSVQ